MRNSLIGVRCTGLGMVVVLLALLSTSTLGQSPRETAIAPEPSTSSGQEASWLDPPDTFALNVAYAGLVALVPTENEYGPTLDAFLVRNDRHCPLLRIPKKNLANPGQECPTSTSCAAFPQEPEVCNWSLEGVKLSIGSGATMAFFQKRSHVRASGHLPSSEKEAGSSDWIGRMSLVHESYSRVGEYSKIDDKIFGSTSLPYGDYSSCRLAGENGDVFNYHFSPRNWIRSQALADVVESTVDFVDDGSQQIQVILRKSGGREKTIWLKYLEGKIDIFVGNLFVLHGGSQGSMGASDESHFEHYYDISEDVPAMWRRRSPKRSLWGGAVRFQPECGNEFVDPCQGLIGPPLGVCNRTICPTLIMEPPRERFP